MDALKNAQSAQEQSKREIDARIKLEKRFIWQGPRDIPINSSQDLFRRELKPFTGQHFRMSVCKTQVGDISWGSEIMLTQQAIRIALSKAGLVLSERPGWGPLPIVIPGCGGGAGILVMSRTDSAEITKSAGRAISSVIGLVLNQTPMFSVSDSGSFAGVVETFPDEIDIHVSPHPVLPGDPQRTSPEQK